MTHDEILDERRLTDRLIEVGDELGSSPTPPTGSARSRSNGPPQLRCAVLAPTAG